MRIENKLKRSLTNVRLLISHLASDENLGKAHKKDIEDSYKFLNYLYELSNEEDFHKAIINKDKKTVRFT
tara:strand:- start:2255 stop:2464 length:210 start_codon:yes stop_codon:yes gene_type:complete